MKKFITVLICITILVQLFTMPGIAAETADVFIGMPPEPEIVILDDAVITQSSDDISLFDIGYTTSPEYKTTMSFEGEYFEAYIEKSVEPPFEEKVLKAIGKIASTKKKCMIIINDASGIEKYRSTADVNSGSYSISADLSVLDDGKYYFSLFFGIPKDSHSYTYTTTLKDIPFYVTNDKIVFEHPFTEDKNAYYKSFIENNEVDKSFYLKIPEDELTEEQYNEIHATAVSVTAGLTDDYDKIVAVHDYIAENTYYDSIAAEKNEIEDQADPYYVYNQKRGVCTGFARLMRAMLVSIGIPTVCVLGFADSGVDWDSNAVYKTNHEWNWVYCKEKGRWLTIDTTWDCGNKYKMVNGNATKIDGDLSYMYFDADNNSFSTTHKTDGMRRNDEGWTNYFNGEGWINYFIVAVENVCYNLTDADFECSNVYDNPTKITLESSINGCSVYKIPENFMVYDNSVSTLSIPDSIKEIGDYAFFGTEKLETVYCNADIAEPINIDSGILLAGEKIPKVYCKTNSYMYNYLEGVIHQYNNANVEVHSLTDETLSNVCLYHGDGDTVLEFELADSFSGGRMFLAYYKDDEITYCKSDMLSSASEYLYDDISEEFDDETVIKLFIWEDNIKPYGTRTILYRFNFD